MKEITVKIQLESGKAKLPGDVDGCHELIEQLLAENAFLRRQMFAAKADTLPTQKSGQDDLFEEKTSTNEAETKTKSCEAEEESPSEPAEGTKRGRRDLSAGSDIPVSGRVVYDVEEGEKTCGGCGHARHPMPSKFTYKLVMIPAHLEKLEIECRQYACGNCQTGVVTASKPQEILPKCLADESLLSWVVTSRYCDHMPLHRLSQSLHRYGIDLSKSTMTDWMISLAGELKVIYARMLERMRQACHLHIDETTTRIQAPGSCREAWFWVLNSPALKYSLYEFSSSRGRAAPEGLLEGFSGVIQSDAFKVYKSLTRNQGHLTLAGCMAHARRKFVDAVKITGCDFARQVVLLIKKIYREEQQLDASCPGKRLAGRQVTVRPLVENLFAMLKSAPVQAVPNSPTGKAVSYALENEKPLCVFLENGHVGIDNNPVERAIRPTTIGRKNSLFFGSEDGANAAAVLYTLVESAKLHGLNVFEYLKDIFRKLPGYPMRKIDDLLPDNWQPQQP